VKSGTVIEKWQNVGRGQNQRNERVKQTVSRSVYFPERHDGKADLTDWCLTEKQALFCEAVEKDEEINKLTAMIEQCYKAKNARWAKLHKEFGLDGE
jgi:hypothetical protein